MRLQGHDTETTKYNHGQIESMISIFLVLSAGIAVGYLFRSAPFIRHLGSIISLLIALLLFVLGYAVGSNQEVIQNFSNIGLNAFIITLGGVLGSVLCGWWVYVRFFKKKENR